MPHARPEAPGEGGRAWDRELAAHIHHADPHLEAETVVDEEEEEWERREHDMIPDERTAEEHDNTGDPLAAEGPIDIASESYVRLTKGGVGPLVAAELREQVADREEVKDRLMHEVTPAAVQQKILQLRGIKLAERPGFNLNHEIQERSRISLEWSYGLFEVSWFRSHHTGASAPTQDYCCPHHGCKACVKFQVGSGTVIFQGARWEHNHPIEHTRCQGLRSLTNARKAKIRELTSKNMTSAQIHRQMGFAISPSVLGDVRRDELTELKSNEVLALVDAVKD
jgi:hypothetical protein